MDTDEVKATNMQSVPRATTQLVLQYCTVVIKAYIFV